MKENILQCEYILQIVGFKHKTKEFEEHYTSNKKIHVIENNLLYEDFDPTEIHYSNTFIKNPNISRKELEDIRKNVWREYMSVKIDLKDYNERGWASTL